MGERPKTTRETPVQVKETTQEALVVWGEEEPIRRDGGVDVTEHKGVGSAGSTLEAIRNFAKCPKSLGRSLP